MLLLELASRPWPLLLPDVEVREPRVVFVELVNLWLVSIGLVACKICQYRDVCVGNGVRTWLVCWLLGMMMVVVQVAVLGIGFEVGGSRVCGVEGEACGG